MKVLHVINSLDIGGAQTLLNDALPEFEKKGVKSDVLVLKKSTEGNLEQLLKSKGINIIYSKVNNIYNPLQITEIKKVIRNDKYDIVHSHTFPSQYWVSLLRYMFQKKPKLITTEHNTSNRRREKKIFKYIDNFIYKSYSKIICISEGTRNELITWDCDVKDKSIVVENGIDLNKFNNAKSLDKTDLVPHYRPGDTILLMVARLTPQKDHETVIKSMLKLPENIYVVFVGDGEKHSEYLDMINTLNLNDKVILLGAREDIPNIMKAADLFVLSSHFEGFGLVVLEAMACGLPVIGSNVAGLTDIVSGAGRLFEKGDINQLSTIIKELAVDKKTCASMVKAGNKKSSLYSIDKFVEKHINVYKSIL
ncbi:glycosyltransferase [Bacillus sp. ISL-57]|uniref:glycosyltransferase n=1 Tax=Bacillus sp. ISL-57 TaxID=2819135 RepID=UPI001BEB6D40|nr:glycosyltransferase [Bacillus sp. ISL-57]MBT2718163.1 glycosyltransferase [Bacillus sp. ISL-57]